MSAQASQDLWKEAVESLGKETKLEIDLFSLAAGEEHTGLYQQIPSLSQERKAVLKSLLGICEKGQKDAADNAWSSTRWNGEKVILRDVFAKLVKWIKHFETAGDIMSSYDPAHVALPWAGVKILLQIAIGDTVVRGALMERLAFISELICRNALLETMVESSDVSLTTREELFSFLVRLYAAVLVFLGMARKYYTKSTAGRIWKYGVLQSKSIDDAFGNIVTAQAQVDTCRDNLNLEATLQTHDKMRSLQNQFGNPPDRWSPLLQNIQDHIHVSKRTTILQWVSNQPYAEHHNEAKKDVLEGTGQWLLQHPSFTEWKNQSASSVLWLHGIPGSGKSKLVSRVIENVLEAYGHTQEPSPVYFYCSRNTREMGRSDPTEIARCLARQLARPSLTGGLLEPLVRLYFEREINGFATGKPSLKESEDIILRLLSHYKNSTVTIVIDALDECQNTRHELLDMLENILQKSPCLLKMFFSSRDDQDIAFRLDRRDRNYGSLKLSSDLNADDINMYIQSRVSADVKNGLLLRNSNNSIKLQGEIIDRLQSKADGMFRWASLQLDMLRLQKSDNAIEERLGKLPRSLEGLYDDIMRHTEGYEAEADRDLARNTFSWLLSARQNIPSNDFLVAIGYSNGRLISNVKRETLLGICCNLVVYDASLDTFRFSHLSIQEFLEQRENYASTCTNALIAEACLFHVVNGTFQRGDSIGAAGSRQLLKMYCTLYWPFHAQISDLREFCALRRLIERLVQDATNPESPATRWIAGLRKSIGSKLWNDFPRPDREKFETICSIQPFHLALFINFDLVDLVDEQEWAMRRSMCSPDGTLEKLVIQRGSMKVLSRCLEGGKLELGPTKSVALAALTQGRWGSCLEHVGALLIHRRRVINDIVETAAGDRWYGTAAMAMLLKMPEVSITKRIVRTAADNLKSGHRIMRLIFDKRGNEVPTIDENIVRTALQNHWSGDDIMDLFLKKRGDELSINKDTVVAAAVKSRGENNFMTKLLKTLYSKEPISESRVVAAIESQKGSVRLLRLLFEMHGNNVPINKRIVLAAVKGYRGKKIMEILIKKRRASTMEMIDTDEILTAAAENPRANIIRLLHKNGISIPQHILDLNKRKEEVRKSLTDRELRSRWRRFQQSY